MKTQFSGKLHNQRGRLALAEELLSHLVCHDSSEAISSNAIRALGLNFSDFGKVKRRNVFKRRVLKLAAIHAFRFDAVERLVGVHFRGKTMHEKRAASPTVDAEEWRAASGFFHRDQRGVVRIF